MKTQVHSLILLVLLASTALAQNNAQTRRPVIDVHMHAYAKDTDGTTRCPIRLPDRRSLLPMSKPTCKRPLRR